MDFKRHDLTDPTAYTWTAALGDNPHLRKIDATRLNMHEGYEVLAFLNVFAHEALITDQKTFRLAEHLLLEKPGNIQSREHAFQWLMDAWKKKGPLAQFRSSVRPR